MTLTVALWLAACLVIGFFIGYFVCWSDIKKLARQYDDEKAEGMVIQ